MRISSDDAEIDVEIAGSGSAVVLLHAFPVTRDEWDAQARDLARQALVIRPDLRGAGRSSVPEGPYLMETLAGDVAAVLDALRVDRAAIVGHSLGGYVAMAFARMHTERVERLALVCSRLSADTEQTARDRNELADRAERDGSIDAIADAYLPRLFAGTAEPNRAECMEKARAMASRIPPRGAAALLRGMAQRVDSYDIAEELAMPVLIVAGAHDAVVPRAESEAMQRAFSNAQLQLLERSGHMPTLEDPDELSARLRLFLCEES